VAPPALHSVRVPRQEYAHRVSFRLPVLAPSVSAARAYVRELLQAWGLSPELCDDAVLVTSELVTDVIAHADSEEMVCRLRAGEERLYVEVEVEDRARTFPTRTAPAADSRRGRGLLLVDTLSQDWGVTDAPLGSGRIVWAELPSAPPPAGAQLRLVRPAAERP
jgi:anti-sigma regulatory factor (Ser/Thr protein kinase)